MNESQAFDEETRVNASDESSQEQAIRQRWIDETLRLYTRYQTEFVEAFDLCPWAKRARLDGQVQVCVCLDDGLNVEAALSQLDTWVANDAIEIGILIFPACSVERDEIERFATRCMAADAARLGLQSPQFVLAAFHPAAPLVLDPAERLVPFLRRSPDPTLQFVRARALQRVRRGETTGTQFVDPSSLDFANLWKPSGPSLRERIMAANRDTFLRVGTPEVNRVLDAVLEDHRCSRAQLPALPARADARQAEGPRDSE
jgi:hypothetical protein